MYFQKKSFAVILGLWLVLTMLYYNNFHLLHEKLKPDLVVKEMPFEDKILPLNITSFEDFLINTPGCYIPNYAKTFKFYEAKNTIHHCFRRIVFVERTSGNEVKFRIDYKSIRRKGHTFKCCYRYVVRSSIPGREDYDINYTKCTPFKNGSKINLVEETVDVSCNLYSITDRKTFNYRDRYLILKKKTVKRNDGLKKTKWNVLIVGMDTMSRARAYDSLTKTVVHLRTHRWLDFQGYQKIGYNTFPNAMAILAGLNLYIANRACKLIDDCKHLLLWNKYKEAGYMTAYGEDQINLPDTFARHGGFKFPPTDHYSRPFFIIYNYLATNVLCLKSRPTAYHLLDYATQFTQAYKDNGFFGYFWINSYSHDLVNVPSLLEDKLIRFFKTLNCSGVLENTFVFFLSDHGLRFGPVTKQRETYYEQRLPMFYMWVPRKFQKLYPDEYFNLLLNQYRLTTPYDVHATLGRVLKLSDSSVDVFPPQSCPQCRSLTEEVSPERTCADAKVEERWCSCHVLEETKIAANRSLELAVEYVQNMAKLTKTAACTICSPLQLKTVLRNDWFKDNNDINITYYVLAFAFSPGDVAFEATVKKYGDNFTILHPTHTISPYRDRSDCVINRQDRDYCVCMKVENCSEINN